MLFASANKKREKNKLYRGCSVYLPFYSIVCGSKTMRTYMRGANATHFTITFFIDAYGFNHHWPCGQIHESGADNIRNSVGNELPKRLADWLTKRWAYDGNSCSWHGNTLPKNKKFKKMKTEVKKLDSTKSIVDIEEAKNQRWRRVELREHWEKNHANIQANKFMQRKKTINY